jgi:hypothetical protein
MLIPFIAKLSLIIKNIKLKRIEEPPNIILCGPVILLLVFAVTTVLLLSGQQLLGVI